MLYASLYSAQAAQPHHVPIHHKDGDELLFILSAAANTSGKVLGRLDFLPNLKDSIHNFAMSVNATTSTNSPCRRLFGFSTSRSRFRTHGSHHRWTSYRRSFRRQRSRWNEIPILQVLNHPDTVLPISLPLLYPLACLLPVIMIRVRVRVFVGA